MVFIFSGPEGGWDSGCVGGGEMRVGLETARVIYFEKQNCDDCAMRATREGARARPPPRRK